jgi:fructose-bisphosphate aldolase, class I
LFAQVARASYAWKNSPRFQAHDAPNVFPSLHTEQDPLSEARVPVGLVRFSRLLWWGREAACHEAGLVPVAEPEVLADGSHSLAACEAVTSLVLLEVMNELHEYRVDFESLVVKPNMAVPGLDSGLGVTPEDVAEATLGALNGLPATVAGVAFLSGGQRPEQATANLAALQWLPHVWPLTFSFGRALAGPALAAWHGDPACLQAGQRALAHRVAMNVAALEGRYSPELDLDLDPA